MIFQENMKEFNSSLVGGVAMLLLFVFSFSSSFCQSRQQLEQQRKVIIGEIQKTEKALQRTQKNKEDALNEFLFLEKQVGNRKELVENIQTSIAIIALRIDTISNEIIRLQDDLDLLEQEYGLLMRHAYRLKLNDNWFVFLLSAKSINNAYMRWQYIRQFEQFRKKQIKLLQDKLVALEVKKQELGLEKNEKNLLFESEQEQNQLLKSELDKKNELVEQLSASEKKLAKSLEEQRKAQEKIKSAIEALINAEIARNSAVNSDAGSARIANLKLRGESAAFYSAKGKLKWPVPNEGLIRGFGKQNHPVLKSIQINNNGIDVKTRKGATVKSIFEGEVLSVQYIPGFKFTVIIKHGIFYSVYSNLEEVFTKRGEMVEEGVRIGKIPLTNNSFHFELWEQKNKLNPVLWLE